MEYTERYTARSGNNYTITIAYDEKIHDRDGANLFLQSVYVTDENRQKLSLPTLSTEFSTFEDFTSFGSYTSINYQGVREAAIDGLRLKILTRIEDQLEGLG